MSLKPIGALWINKTKEGMEYFVGNINDQRVLAFWNDKQHKHSEKSPDLQVFLGDDKKKK